jgi:hypothetical protein
MARKEVTVPNGGFLLIEVGRGRGFDLQCARDCREE